jgi:hypothetical protein
MLVPFQLRLNSFKLVHNTKTRFLNCIIKAKNLQYTFLQKLTKTQHKRKNADHQQLAAGAHLG